MFAGGTPPSTPPASPRMLYTLSGIRPVPSREGTLRGPASGNNAYVVDLERYMWSVRGFSDSSDQDEAKKEEAEPVAMAESSAVLERPPGLPGPTYDRSELLGYDDGEGHVCYGFYRMDGGVKVCVDLLQDVPNDGVRDQGGP